MFRATETFGADCDDVSAEELVCILPVCTFQNRFGRCVKPETMKRSVFSNIPINFPMLAAATADPTAATCSCRLQLIGAWTWSPGCLPLRTGC